MEEIMQRGQLFMVGRLAGLALLAVALSAKADADSPKGMQRYVIPIKNCAVEFMAKAGGYTDIVRSSPLASGYFQHDNYYSSDRVSREMSFSIRCHPGSAKEICPKLMEAYRSAEKGYARDVQLRRLGELNDHYYSEAYIHTWSAVSPPRPRTLSFCMGDEHRAVMTRNGDWLLGYDPREITEARGKPILKRSEYALPDVLAIIRSMRFIPDPTPKQDSR